MTNVRTESSPRVEASRAELLSPIDRISEVLFGLIMALTFTGSLSVATADRAEVRTMLFGALGCNIAWGLIDAVMFLMAAAAERGRSSRLLRSIRSDPGAARAIISENLPPLVAQGMPAAELDSIRDRLLAMPEPRSRFDLTGRDFSGAVMVFLLVFLSTLPVVLPFLFLTEAHHALRVSNAIALVMLFFGGWRVGHYAGRSPLLLGTLTLGIGVLLVAATIALGG